MNGPKLEHRWLILLGFVVFFGLVFWLYSGRSLFFGQQSTKQKVTPSEILRPKANELITLTVQEAKQAIAGKQYTMLTYNGSIPGPQIRVKQGDTIQIKLVNQSSRPQLLHPHGVRVDNAYDGTTLVQKLVQPGESFVYKLTFADPGVFWYHPHEREDLNQEVGLYGAFMVEPRDQNYWGEQVSKDDLIVVDDLLSTLPSDGAVDHAMMGRYGDVLLVNGSVNPTLQAKANQPIRYSILNAANARPFRLRIPGARLKLVGSDNGAYEQARWVDEIIIGPSERYIVHAMFEKVGQYELQNIGNSKATMARINVTDGVGKSPSTYEQLQANSAVSKSIEPYLDYFDKAPDKTLRFDVRLDHGGMGGHGMMHGSAQNEQGIEWEDDMNMMNRASTKDNTTWILRDEQTKKENMDIMWSFAKDSVIKIRVINDKKSMHPMQHPFHVHGQRFLVTDIDGVRQTNFVWKDTTMIPAGATYDILVPMDNPGMWMMHCHIAEHLETGMMLHFTVK